MDILTEQQKETCRLLGVSQEDFLKTKKEDEEQALNQKWADVTPEDRATIDHMLGTT